MSVIHAVQSLIGPATTPDTTSNSDSDLFASLLNGAQQTASASASTASSLTIAPSTRAALLQLQEASPTAQAGPPTALSGLGGTIDPTSERQMLQTFGADFAHSMDTNGDGTVTESELVDKLHNNGGLDPALGERLYNILNPKGGSMTDAQMAAAATSTFAPPWLNNTSS